MSARPSSPPDARPTLADPFSWREPEGLALIDVALPGAGAAFSTRRGGVSSGPFESLNLGVLTKDPERNPRENRRRLTDALGIDPDGIAMGWQVHGAAVARLSAPRRPNGFLTRAELPKLDGHATAGTGVIPTVLTADCLPVLLAAPGAVAALHCGWRGLAAGIVAEGMRSLAELAGAEPDAVHAAIGPGAGPCCYAVGAEVEEAMAAAGLAEAMTPAGTLDLPLVARRALEAAGVPPAQVATVGICTICTPMLFFSHRREGGITGRQTGLVWLR